MNNDEPKVVGLGAAARLLGVPAKWLRSEAEAGRLPHLKAGDVLLFDPKVVERIVLERLRQADGKGSRAPADEGTPPSRSQPERRS